MAHLNLASNPAIVLNVLPAQLEATLPEAELGRLIQDLSAVFSPEGGELKLELPRGWTVYFKLRDGESRGLLAHPEHDQWVATIALEPSHAQGWLDQLKGEGQGRVGSAGALGRGSNFDLTLKSA